MTVKLTRTQYVDAAGGHTVSLASMLSRSIQGNPAYLVVTALDRDEYTVNATGATGCFTGNGQTLTLASIGGDARSAGIVFTWNASTDTYASPIYGTLAGLDWTDPTSAYDITNISFFGTASLQLANEDASDAYAMVADDAAGYIGSVTFASDNGYTGKVPAPGTAPSLNATPDGVAAAALAMVGKPWNDNGCWVLASTIAAEAGSGLPVQSTLLEIPGQSNGAWYVLYNGPAGASGNWQSLVATGDMVAFITASGGGHITTCVSGAGATAQLVDNIMYVNGSGSVQNSAHDGSPNDVLIAAPHPASQEFAGVDGREVVIYALDTPVVHDLTAADTVSAGATVRLGGLFSVSDPLQKSISGFQLYLTNATDTLLVNGKTIASSAAGPMTVASLNGLALLAGSAAGADQIELRAYNGLYWGDWQTLTVNDTAPNALSLPTQATAHANPTPMEMLPLFHPHQ